MNFRVSHIAFIGLFFFTGCYTTNEAYWTRSELEDGQNADHWAIIPSEIQSLPDRDYASFKKALKEQDRDESVEPFYRNLRVIEYDDYGDKWESRQTTRVVDLIETSPPGTDVVVFFHGWRNNAKPENGDLKRFNSFMHKFSKTEGNENAIGVFVGWRGASIRTDHGILPLDTASQIPSFLSFMNRRAATGRVADIPLESDLWKIREASMLREGRVTLVGHSFGARILERVVTPSLISAYSQKRYMSGSDTEEMRRRLQLADLVVLVNPATEALHARETMLALRHWPDSEPPVIVALRSESDSATNQIWKIGKSLDRIVTPTLPKQDRVYKLGHHRDPYRPTELRSQWSYLNTTPGRNERTRTGKILLDEDLNSFKYCVARNPEGLSANAYANFEVSKNILHGHGGEPEQGGIFSDNMFTLVKSIFDRTISSSDYKGSDLQMAILKYKREDN